MVTCVLVVGCVGFYLVIGIDSKMSMLPGMLARWCLFFSDTAGTEFYILSL